MDDDSDRGLRYCDCACLGCLHFHGSGSLAEGQDAHHSRILIALDRSIAAACQSRGVAACDGLNDDAPCEVGTLHTRAAALAAALANAIENPDSEEYDDGSVQVAARELLIELGQAFAGKPRPS